MTTIDICRQCQKTGTSCCTNRSDDNQAMIHSPVSEPEMKTIMNFLRGNTASRIFVEKRNTVFYVRQMQNLFPGKEKEIATGFPVDGNHFELNTEDDACVLLGPKGCLLPKEIRPHFCRIYPFWFFGDEPHIFRDPDCLALSSHQTVAEVFLSLGTTPETLKQIHEQLCHDLGLSPSRLQAELKSS